MSNGLGFSPDDTRMYFTDTSRRTIYVYDFDPARGDIAHRRPFVELAEAQGRPDGLTVDAEGFVWVALWDGWTILRYDPDGRVALRVPLPARPTSCCFGGADLRTLFVTSASARLPEQALADAPLSGVCLARPASWGCRSAVRRRIALRRPDGVPALRITACSSIRRPDCVPPTRR